MTYQAVSAFVALLFSLGVLAYALRMRRTTRAAIATWQALSAVPRECSVDVPMIEMRMRLDGTHSADSGVIMQATAERMHYVARYGGADERGWHVLQRIAEKEGDLALLIEIRPFYQTVHHTNGERKTWQESGESSID